ncbi:peptidoglycan-binding protein [Lysobacter silvisoli]|uniref:Peptidoglycan-binding protein n=2 Tax=Lysobacter silvisoli TaxID=2293254 RepID=A0A371JWT5_9GAMM|nr:peptidoglycan-binding protein [Lysobacter silvisoli]
MEVDTRYHQQFDQYVDDLASGRLSLDPPRRGQGIEPRPVVDDGIIRIGETDDRVRAAAAQLNAAGYRGADGQRLNEDGVYRLSMQAAVINYQTAQGLPATGNLDQATLQRLVPPTQTQDAPAPNAPAPNAPAPNAPPAAPQGAQPAPPPGQRGAASGPLGSNDPLLPQAEAATRRLDASLGRQYDGNSACMAASAACLARREGLTSIDHIVLSNANVQGVAAGQNMIVVQGDLQNPGRQLASMRTDDAVRTPVADSVAQLNRLYDANQQANPAQEAQVQGRQAGRTA